jgi:hypothetical protein
MIIYKKFSRLSRKPLIADTSMIIKKSNLENLKKNRTPYQKFHCPIEKLKSENKNDQLLTSVRWKVCLGQISS